ncbi:hypothetical protein ACFQMA_03075 [Halosimplex aquaticum]|uniref:SPW repeat-containing protein n=1 Tax=Halosimplex aquaticum TaxID=3026162 RepID=A0ABD5XUR2_9EURY|nr:hypothetical protein [Halosimplex aquaticum]
MESETGGSAWLPDRLPTWIDVGVGLLSVALFAKNLTTASQIAWGWVAAGFVATVLVTGPVAQSAMGADLGEWFTAIGPLGRAAAIVAFAVAVWAVDEFIGIPAAIRTGLASGVFLGVAVLVAAHVLSSRAVEGW